MNRFINDIDILVYLQAELTCQILDTFETLLDLQCLLFYSLVWCLILIDVFINLLISNPPSNVAGLNKLSAADGVSLSDPEVLKRLTDQVSSAMDEAASSLIRFKAEQQHHTPGNDSPWLMEVILLELKNIVVL